ncbi:MAG: hypothetical protein V3T89_00110 [bacterium]
MKRYFLKIKKIVSPGRYFLLIVFFLNLFLLSALSVVPQSDEKGLQENLTPALFIIEGGTGPAEEVALHLSQELLVNDFAVTVGITPYLNKRELIASDSLVKKLRELYNRYPDNISFALQGLEHVKYELNKSLPEQIHILSRAQSIFTQAFNRDRYDYFHLATTLLPPYGHYNRDIAAAARQAGIKVVIGGDTSGSKGYALLECDVAEVPYDSEASMIADWRSSKIRSPQELIESMTGVLKKSSAENPLVMVINAGILYNQVGTEKAKGYVDELMLLLDGIRSKENLEFMTSAEYYRRFIGGKQDVVLRLDDYQTPSRKGLFEKVANGILELDVPLTISIIPYGTGKLSEDPDAITYLNSTLEKELVEVTLHGYDHRKGGEFTLSLGEQIGVLRKALAESEKILSYDEVFSLVPPYNVSNEFTSKAIRTVNKEGHQLRVISSGMGDKYMIGFDPEGIYHISRTIDAMKSYNSPYPLYSVEEIVAAIGYDDAVLNIHPWSLAGQEKQDIILEVIKRLKERPNVEFVTFAEYYSSIDPTLSAHWQPGYTLRQVTNAQRIGRLLIFLFMLITFASI